MSDGMKTTIGRARTFLVAHRRAVLIATPLVLLALVLVALFAYNFGTSTKVVYQPVKACERFTPAEAQDLLGDKILSVDTKKPAVSGDIAISKCSYTDQNPDQNAMKVAAVAIRSGVNDDGVAQNKREFAASKKANPGVQDVPGLGDTAYFNPVNGQMGILQGRDWLIVSYGAGATPQANTIEDVTKLSQMVLK